MQACWSLRVVIDMLKCLSRFLRVNLWVQYCLICLSPTLNFRKNGISRIRLSDSCDILLLMHTDDLIIFGKFHYDLSQKLSLLNEYCVMNMLELNVNKTNFIKFHDGRPERPFKYKVQVIKTVSKVSYLDVQFSRPGEISTGFYNQILCIIPASLCCMLRNWGTRATHIMYNILEWVLNWVDKVMDMPKFRYPRICFDALNNHDTKRPNNIKHNWFLQLQNILKSFDLEDSITSVVQKNERRQEGPWYYQRKSA